MKNYSKYLTGKTKNVLRFRKDRSVWENRVYSEMIDCKNNSIWIRSDNIKKGLEYQYSACSYEPYKSARKGKLFRIWAGMIQRCNNVNHKKYSSYGGRGIKIDKRWLHFPSFYDDMHKGYSNELEIDRIDNDGDYAKENCRWATRKTQCNNTRWNRKITIDGETLNVGQWAIKYGKKPNTVVTRIVKYGWNPKDAVKVPLKKNQYSFL